MFHPQRTSSTGGSVFAGPLGRTALEEAASSCEEFQRSRESYVRFMRQSKYDAVEEENGYNQNGTVHRLADLDVGPLGRTTQLRFLS